MPKLYAIRLTDDRNQEMKLVVANRQSHAASFGELIAARMSRISGVTWRLAVVAEILEAEDAVDRDRKWAVRVE